MSETANKVRKPAELVPHMSSRRVTYNVHHVRQQKVDSADVGRNCAFQLNWAMARSDPLQCAIKVTNFAEKTGDLVADVSGS